VSAEAVVETIEFPESLSVTLANSLALAFRTYYFPSRVTDPSAGLRTRSNPNTGQIEYYWTLLLPRAKSGAALSDRDPVGIHITITSNDVKIEVTSPRPTTEDQRLELSTVTEDLRAFVASFLEFAKRSSLYVAVLPYPRTAAEKANPTKPGSEALRSIFSGNSTNVFILVVILCIPAILILGYYALVLIVGAQAVILYYSDRIAVRMGSARPSAQRPRSTVIGVTLGKDPQSPEPIHLQAPVSAVRGDLEDAIAEAEATGGDAQALAAHVLQQAGIPCSREDVEITTRDVYDLVGKAALRFGLPVPQVIISETPVANAAATGISPHRASMMITAGSLEELSDSQLEAVIGHELGHIRGRDPVILLGANAVLYLGALFLWPSVLEYLGFGYFLLALVTIFLLGKVLETRADTESALMLGEAGDLASALTRIAFKELYGEERSSPVRFFRWLTPDPHPPVYFRIKRLVKIASQGAPSRHTFLISARDCLAGFFGALVGRE
jgi:heat shock protein HtpX